MSVPPLLLASTSPRRHSLLTAAGVAFEAVDPGTEELDASSGHSPHDLVLANARLKAESVARRNPGRLVLGADTIVVLDDTVLGKPASLDEARTMLARLAGNTHLVLTGVALLRDADATAAPVDDAWVETTTVTFHPLDAARIEDYLDRVHVLDKAGAYGIQEHGDLLVSRVDGLVSNVTGLPVERIAPRLARHGV